MKIKALYICLTSLCIVCCKTRKITNTPIYEDIIGTVTKIDSTQSGYIINIEYEGGKKAVFLSQKKNCSIKRVQFIAEGKIYKFSLLRLIYNNNEKEIQYEEDNKIIWSSKSGIDYFEDSKNTCGLYLKKSSR